MDKHLARKVAALLKENPAIVSMAIDSTAKFIEKTIRSGEMKNVRIPMLGIFKVNLRQLRYLTEHKPAEGIVVITAKPPVDEETICNQQ
jgi:nucleoid DNA-binding protein